MTNQNKIADSRQKNEPARSRRIPGSEVADLALVNVSPENLLLAQRAIANPRQATPATILGLQQTAGNRAVSHFIQTKLMVGPAKDHYEQEADRVAEQVVNQQPAVSRGQSAVQRQPEEEEVQTKPLVASITPLVQRQAEEEEEVQTKLLQRRPEDEEEPLQGKSLLQRQPEEEEEPLQGKSLLQRRPEDEEEPLQGKSLLQRRPEDEEEPLQGKSLLQRRPEDEEEPLQGKSLLQRQPEDEEEPLQGKSLLQRQPEEEEEPLQGKSLLQRQPEEEEEPLQGKSLLQRQPEEEEEPIQGKSLLQRQPDGSFEAGAEIEQRLAANKGGGNPLPADTRAFMEPRFGADFSGVRIHTGGESNHLNRQLSAQAFTRGQDIYLGEGRYDPGSAAGQRLLAHELTHVIQQGAVSRQTGPAIQRNIFTRAGRAVGGAVSTAGKAVGGAASKAGQKIDEKAGEAGAFIGGAARTAGYAIADKATAFKNWARDLNLGIEDDAVEPVPRQANYRQNMDNMHDYAGELMHAMNMHQYKTAKHSLFLAQDGLALQDQFKTAVEDMGKQKAAMNAIHEPAGLGARFKKSATEQQTAQQAKIKALTAKITELQNETTQAQGRQDRAKAAAETLTQYNTQVEDTYDDVRDQLQAEEAGSTGPVSPALINKVKQAAVIERQAVHIRNDVTKDVNIVRRSGRSQQLVTTVLKTVAAKAANVGLKTVTLTMLGVDTKDRPGEYNSTIRVTNLISKSKAEFKRLQAIGTSTLYGNKAASIFYACLKGLSTLIIVPVRDLAGTLALISTGIGALLGAVTLGAAAAPFATASTILTYIGIGLTGLNALINATLAIWSRIRLAVLKNEHKRDRLKKEVMEGAATSITEAVSAGASAAGVGIRAGGISEGFHTATESGLSSHELMGEFLKGHNLVEGGKIVGKPVLGLTLLATGLSTGTDIAGQAIPSKAGEKFSSRGLMEKEKEKGNIMHSAYQPHRGLKIGIKGHGIEIPQPHYPARVKSKVGDAADWVKDKAIAGKKWAGGKLTSAKTSAEEGLRDLYAKFLAKKQSLGTTLGKVISTALSITNIFTKIKTKLASLRKGKDKTQDANDVTDIGANLGGSVGEWLKELPNTFDEADKWAGEQVQAEGKV